MSCWTKLAVAFFASWFSFGGCNLRIYTASEQASIRINQCETRRPFNSRQRPRLLRVKVSENFTHLQRIWIEKGFRTIEQNLNYTFQYVNSEVNDISVVRLSANQAIIGFYRPQSTILQIDGTRNAFEITGTTIHEFFHWIGMQHVCVAPGELDSYGVPVNCSPVGYGRAAINPIVRSSEQTTITRLDLAELRRTQTCQFLGF